MKLTVAQYASSRNISEATVKNAIKKKQWELEQNPNDNRQRLLSLQQQSELDQAIPKAAIPSAIPTVPVEVMPYQRPNEVGMVLAERAVSVGNITYNPQSVVDNPLYQAKLERLNAIKAQNHHISQQMQVNLTAAQDTTAAIDSLHQLEIVQKAQARAFRDHQLEQTAYDLARQDLEMQAAGLTPVVPSSPAAQPTAPQPHPTEYAKSPF